MSNWDELRTAFYVAREGTVSGAAAALGVHHATVIRHVDALEERLGTKLFQRHARGYTATEAGRDLLQVAQTTDDQISQLESRLKGRGSQVGGELVVTTLPGMAPIMAPILTSFGKQHPSLVVRYLTSSRLFRLEYGEAHVAIRAGRVPQEPDNVVQKFHETKIGLYASKEYIARKGMPRTDASLSEHNFVVFDDLDSRAPFYKWLYSRIKPEQATFRATETQGLTEAVLAGAGLGFMAVWSARRYPDLVEVMAPKDEWSAPFWLVTHMDLHRTAKVQAFLKHLKEASAGWDF